MCSLCQGVTDFPSMKFLRKKLFQQFIEHVAVLQNSKSTMKNKKFDALNCLDDSCHCDKQAQLPILHSKLIVSFARVR